MAKIITLAVLIRTLIPDFMKLEVMDKFSKTIFYKELYNAMKWLPCFLMGILFAKYNLFIKIKVWAIENKIDRLSLYIMLCVITAYIRHRNNNTANYDYLLAPMFILSILEIIKRFHFENAFRYLGKHSTNMWLVHSFFCYYYWQNIVFLPKYSVLITIWLIILSVMTSITLNFVERLISKWFQGNAINNMVKVSL